MTTRVQPHDFTVLLLICLLAIVAGCKSGDESPGPRIPYKLQDLAIGVKGETRGYFLSDKRGGFLSGTIASGELDADKWSVSGKELIRAIQVTVSDSVLTPLQMTSGEIAPHQIRRTYADGSSVVIYPVERKEPTLPQNAVVVEVRTSSPKTVRLDVAPGAGYIAETGGGNVTMASFRSRTNQGRLVLYAGPSGKSVRSGVAVSGVPVATFLMLFDRSGVADFKLQELYEQIGGLHQQRTARMERLLEQAYFRTSDEDLDRAMQWFKLSLDALVIERPDILFVTGLPWDGAGYPRDAAQSVIGFELATGRESAVAELLSNLMRYQDTIPASRNYGRLPARVDGGKIAYSPVDATALFIKQLYEHATWANDTSLVRMAYPFVKRSVEAELHRNVDQWNLITHAPTETWMRGVPRGNRAVELQPLWYFQQLIGSFTAEFVGDTVTARRFNALAEQTAASFNRAFVDTTQYLLYDHLLPDGTGVMERRPNVMYALDIATSERLQLTMMRELFSRLVYLHGVGTLPADDPRFAATATDMTSAAAFNGPVWMHLAGQLTYALTRFDRQDLGYRVTRSMAQLATSAGVTGTLPCVLDVALGAEKKPWSLSEDNVSSTAMAEFVRSVYQDYLGITVDAASRQISLHPKLPAELHKVDCTVFYAGIPVDVKYTTTEGTTRVLMHEHGDVDGIGVTLLWMLDNGDAWRAKTSLLPNTTLTLVINDDDIVAYQGKDVVQLQSSKKLIGFSQRDSFPGMTFAEPPATGGK